MPTRNRTQRGRRVFIYIRWFLAYAATIGLILFAGAAFVHVLMGHEYEVAVTERLQIMAHDGEEAVEAIVPPGRLAPALASVLKAPDEGLTWYTPSGVMLGESGMTATGDAAVLRVRVREEAADGVIRATISNGRVTEALKRLDFAMVAGVVAATFVGALIATLVAARSMSAVEAVLRRVSHFTGDAAHELRTPLAVITANSDSLAMTGADDPTRERSLSNIRLAARQMSELIDGLLILARADEDATLDLHAVDLNECVLGAVERYRADAAAKGLSLTVRLPPSSATLYGQPEQIARIVGNLVENAIRYTPEGGTIEVTHRVGRASAIIEVADTGIGIEPGALGRVFDRFWRAPTSSPIAGSGLGLAIARSLARVHGGDVFVASELGAGSTFTVRLPLHRTRIAGLLTYS